MSTSKARTIRNIMGVVKEAGVTDQEILERIEGGVTSIIAPARELTAQQDMVGALCEVMVVDPALSAAKFTKLAVTLINAGYTAEFIRETYGPDGSFYRNDWRGQRGERPNVGSILNTIKIASDGWGRVGNVRQGMKGVSA